MSRFSSLYAEYKVESWLVLGGVGVCLAYAITQIFLLSDPGRTNFTGLIGLPLDDVYIHLRYAENLQDGYGYSFNPKEILTAATSPLWVLVIAVFGVGYRLELVAIFLSIISYLIIAPGIYRTSRDLLHISESNARLAGWLTVFTSRLAWSAMSGMETALAALLTLLAVEAHIRGYQKKCVSAKEAFWLGIGMLVRPEFAILTAILVIHWLYVSLREEIDHKSAISAVLLLISLSAPALLLPLTTRGSLLAHSSTVQAASANATPFEYLWFAIKTLSEPNALIALLAFVGAAMLFRRSEIQLLAITVVVVVLSQLFFAPQTRHHGRYLFPLLPLLILLGTLALDGLRQRLSQKAVPGISILLILLSIISSARWSYIAASDVRNINDQHLAAAHWLMQNHRPNDVIAAGDVGAIGYLTREHILDPHGLITPAAWNSRSHPDSLWHVLRAKGANVFAIYPRWDRAFFERYKDSLILEASFPVRLPLTSAADTTFNIYRLRRGS